jgi:hypothetical protein
MVLVVAVMIYSVFGNPEKILEIICIAIILILVIDVFCIIGSALYMSHPTNGWKVGNGACSQFNYTSNSFDNPQPCIMPTQQDNPYEQQPLHPIAWMAGFVCIISKGLAGAINLKVT